LAHAFNRGKVGDIGCDAKRTTIPSLNVIDYSGDLRLIAAMDGYLHAIRSERPTRSSADATRSASNHSDLACQIRICWKRNGVLFR
jgi:hypothetical protein